MQTIHEFRAISFTSRCRTHEFCTTNWAPSTRAKTTGSKESLDKLSAWPLIHAVLLPFVRQSSGSAAEEARP
jgi:hypothetical protein